MNVSSRQGDEARKFDREFWQRVDAEVRIAAAWHMVVEVELIRGKSDAGDRRLQRSVQHIQREEEVEYLIVGAYAVMYYAVPRFTKDIDIWVNPRIENAAKVWNALRRFGALLENITDVVPKNKHGKFSF